MYQHTRETLIVSITDATHDLTEEQLKYIHGICWRLILKNIQRRTAAEQECPAPQLAEN